MLKKLLQSYDRFQFIIKKLYYVFITFLKFCIANVTYFLFVSTPITETAKASSIVSFEYSVVLATQSRNVDLKLYGMRSPSLHQNGGLECCCLLEV